MCSCCFSFSFFKGEKHVLFLCGQEKDEKKPQASGLTVGAIREYIPSAPSLRTTEGTQATAEHAERAASALRKPRACGRKLPSRSCLPHGEWWPVRALQHLSSRGYALPSRRMRVRDSVSVSLLVLFSSVRKAHIFSFAKERTHAFLYRKKSIKRTASLRLDRWCNPRVYPVGSRHVFAYHRGTQATAEHAERAASALRKPCACGRELPSRTNFPHGECWLAERSESKQLLGAVGMRFPAED